MHVAGCHFKPIYGAAPMPRLRPRAPAPRQRQVLPLLLRYGNAVTTLLRRRRQAQTGLTGGASGAVLSATLHRRTAPRAETRAPSMSAGRSRSSAFIRTCTTRLTTHVPGRFARASGMSHHRWLYPGLSSSLVSPPRSSSRAASGLPMGSEWRCSFARPPRWGKASGRTRPRGREQLRGELISVRRRPGTRRQPDGVVPRMHPWHGSRAPCGTTVQPNNAWRIRRRCRMCVLRFTCTNQQVPPLAPLGEGAERKRSAAPGPRNNGFRLRVPRRDRYATGCTAAGRATLRYVCACA